MLEELEGALAAPRVALEADGDEVAEGGREAGGDGDGAALVDVVERLRGVGVLLAERRVPGGHLDERAPKAVDVGRAAVLAAKDDLGRHKVRRPAEAPWSPCRAAVVCPTVSGTGTGSGTGTCGSAIEEGSLEFAGTAKVGELEDGLAVLGLVDEDVGALDVAVEDAVGVEVREALEDLARVDADDGLAERAYGREVLAERAAADMLHEEVERAALDARAEVAHDVLVVQRAHQRDLVAELLEQRAHARRAAAHERLLLHRKHVARVAVHRRKHAAVRPAPKEIQLRPALRRRRSAHQPHHVLFLFFLVLVLFLWLSPW